MRLSTKPSTYTISFFFFLEFFKPNPSFFYSSCSTAQDTLECLRSVDVNSLENANLEINNSGFYGTFVFVPVVDGVFITERPSLLLREGKVNINRVRLVIFFTCKKLH